MAVSLFCLKTLFFVACHVLMNCVLFFIFFNFKDVKKMPVKELLAAFFYFSATSTLTVGFGDLGPAKSRHSDENRLFVSIFFLVTPLIRICLWSFLKREYIISIAPIVDNNNKNVKNLIFVVCIAAAIVGSFPAIKHYENITWDSTFYLFVTSATTIGYGDVAFETVMGRCISVFWLPVVVFSYEAILSVLSRYSVSWSDYWSDYWEQPRNGGRGNGGRGNGGRGNSGRGNSGRGNGRAPRP